jgi:hypothetical protein
MITVAAASLLAGSARIRLEEASASASGAGARLAAIGDPSSARALRSWVRVEAGVWVGDIPAMGDLELMVRGLASIAYQTALAVETMSPTRSFCEMQARAAPRLLLGWRGLSDRGRPVRFAPKLAASWLVDGRHGALLDAVLWAAETVR